MADVVLDTCTLMHANNNECEYQEHSIELINNLLNNSLLVTVDEGFDLNEAVNRSYIGLEYNKHLTQGTLGFALISTLAANGRFNFVTNRVNRAVKNYIEQRIVNKKDRMFLRVTYNSEYKQLISHDFEDYQVGKRRDIRRDLNVSIITAEEFNE